MGTEAAVLLRGRMTGAFGENKMESLLVHECVDLKGVYYMGHVLFDMFLKMQW